MPKYCDNNECDKYIPVFSFRKCKLTVKNPNLGIYETFHFCCHAHRTEFIRNLAPGRIILEDKEERSSK